ncbi:hypothetical protein FOA52_015370 [Chlamydomonas sp. UWO 241]|nr:hypothetical protein FOA52_015370 [Chlamydomonas sp. UWO 241]
MGDGYGRVPVLPLYAIIIKECIATGEHICRGDCIVLVEGGEVGEFVFRRLLRLCVELRSSLHKKLGVDLGLAQRVDMGKPIDFALVALGDPDESCRASQALGELGNRDARVRAMVLPLGAACKPGRTSTASLLLVLTEATRGVAALDRERAKHQLAALSSDLAVEAPLPLHAGVLRRCDVRAVAAPPAGAAAMPSEPSVQKLAYQIGACVLEARGSLGDRMQLPLTGVVPWAPLYVTKTRSLSASMTLLIELLEPAAPERLPKVAFNPSKTLNHLMGLGLVSRMEAGVRRGVANTPSPFNHPEFLVNDIRGCMMVLAKCTGHGSLTTGSLPMLSLAVTLRKLLTAMVTSSTWLNSLATGATPSHLMTTESMGGSAAHHHSQCACPGCVAMRAGRLTTASVSIGSMLFAATLLAHQVSYNPSFPFLSGAAVPLRSQTAAALAWTLLPRLLDCMDAFTGSLALFGGEDPEGRYRQAVDLLVGLAAEMDGATRSLTCPTDELPVLLGPEGRVLLSHLAARHPRFMHA